MKQFWNMLIAIVVGLAAGFGWAVLWFPGLAKTGYVIPIAVFIPFLLWLMAIIFYRRKRRQTPNHVSANEPVTEDGEANQPGIPRNRFVRLITARKFVLAFLLSWFVSTILSLLFLIIMLLIALKSFT